MTEQENTVCACGCEDGDHWRPAVASARLNDDALYNRSSLTPDQAMDIGMWDLAPRERGDSMG